MELNKAREKLVSAYLEALKKETIPWEMPWDNSYGKIRNGVSGKAYHGVNQLLLRYVSLENGYEDPRWCTFNQIKNNGWHLENAKGTGVPIEFWSIYDHVNKTKVTMQEYRHICGMDPERAKDFGVISRISIVFNARFIKGIEKLENPQKMWDSNAFIDRFIKNMGVTYKEFGTTASYDPLTDEIIVPPAAAFYDAYGYQSTRLHEACHASGHASRLDRDIKNRYGTEAYAKEELRAEIASSLIAAEAGIPFSLDKDVDNHLAYIQNWIKVLTDQPNELFKAIKDAEKITEYALKIGELEKLKLQESPDLDIAKATETQDTFSIYQLKDSEGTRNIQFEPYERLLAAGHVLDRENYEHIYTVPLANDTTLDDIYTQFNVDHPIDYTGHSLSVSDIVVLHRNGIDIAYYVDRAGFTEVPEFLEEQPLIKEAQAMSDLQIKKPLKMTLDEYLTQRGLESPISDFLSDKMRGNRQLKTERGKKNFEQAAAQAMDDYHTKREAAIAEYHKQVKEHKILPKTSLEQTIETAIYGNPDSKATQAARRMCEKRGIDWQNDPLSHFIHLGVVVNIIDGDIQSIQEKMDELKEVFDRSMDGKDHVEMELDIKMDDMTIFNGVLDEKIICAHYAAYQKDPQFLFKVVQDHCKQQIVEQKNLEENLKDYSHLDRLINSVVEKLEIVEAIEVAL